VREASEIDIAVFGGGIAGLWLLARLRTLGFDAHLFEKTALGHGQTIASQGIIHSGVKYTFDGVNRPQTEALSSMPKIWMDCIAGRGEVDLRGTEILATNQLMFTTGGLVNRIAGAFATKALRSDVGALEPENFPELFRNRKFSGKVYQLEEPVLASRSVLGALHKQSAQNVYHVPAPALRRDGERLVELCCGDVTVRPRLCIFTAGSGNEWFANELGLDKTKVTQRRPLRMFVARGMLHSLFAHCLVPEPKPRVTVTTHSLNGAHVWYLGGNIAEKAVGMSDDEALQWAHSEMTDIFPWLDWSQVRWAIHDVDRAEPAASKLLPSGPTLTTVGNSALAWPTKLALAPALTSQALRWIEQQGLTPSHRTTTLSLPPAELAKYPWEQVREWRLL
jgi:glycine/D-amino acid oxidase-like deaminating enzyme